MGQASYRCVECSQPMTQAGMLCPACQKRTGKSETPAAQTASDAGPLYATALAPPPIYTAPAPQPLDLSGNPVTSGVNASSAMPGYAPPQGPAPGAPLTGAASTAPTAYPSYKPPTSAAATGQRNGAASDDAAQKANMELAFMKLKETERQADRQTSWGERILYRIGTRLAIRLVLVAIAGIVAATGGLKHRQERTAEDADLNNSTSAPVRTNVSNNGSRGPGMNGGFNSQAGMPAGMMSGQISQPTESNAARVEQQQFERVNVAYDDARRALDLAESGQVAQGDMSRLLAQVDSDVQIMRAGVGHLSAQQAPQISQAIEQLTARAQVLENRANMPQMPQSGGGALPENGGGGAQPPADNSGMAGQGAGQQGGGDATGQNQSPPGNGNQ
jgi:hypothetical protein